MNEVIFDGRSQHCVCDDVIGRVPPPIVNSVPQSE